MIDDRGKIDAGPRPSRRFARTPGAGPRRRRVRRVVLLGMAAALGAVGAFRALRPDVDPAKLAARGGPMVKGFALRDARGRLHSAGDWRDEKGVALIFLGADDPPADLKRLAAEYGPRKVAFYAIDPRPDATPSAVAGRIARLGLDIPALADPGQEVAGQLGVTSTPLAVLLAPDGQALFRGPLEGSTRAHGLDAALRAVADGEAPAVAEVDAPGRPLAPAPRSAADERPVTFARDVAPILWKNCASCHRPGEVAPFPLLTYRDAAKRAGFLAEVAESRRMPPWKPHRGFGVFLGAQFLSDRELATLARWAEAGAPEGDPSDLPAPPRFTAGWQLGEPDLVLTMTEPFTVPAGGPDLYRAFVVPTGLDRDRVIEAVEFRPGNPKVAHHSRMFLDETGDSRRRDADDPAPGFESGFAEGGVDIPHPGLGAWTPGMTPRRPPEGVGMAVKPGADVVLVLHYHPVGKPEADRSSLGVYFRKTPPTRSLAGIVMSTPRIDIPAGRARHVIRLKSEIRADCHAYSITPHAHNLLREISVTATLPDGTVQPLLWIDDWAFDWQDQYRFARPVRLPKGTRLDLVARFDNSEANPHNPFKPPRRVRFGPGTTDEMLACHIEVIPDHPDGYRAFKGKSTFGL